MQVTRELSAYCANISVNTVPAEVVARARLLVLDLIGCIVRAGVEAAAAPSLRAMVRAMQWADGDSRVFGDGHRYGAGGAAFLNGALGHALDFDDTHAAGTLHPGAPVISAAIAAGEMTGASGAVVLAAIIAGYEVTCRAALALPAGAHYQRGFHPSATCGVFGAAAAAARVFGLTGPQIESALGIALSQSAGSLQFLVDGAWTKPFQVGWAAMSGLAAATLARDGFRGPAQALEGKHGFLAAYAPAPSPLKAIENLGRGYELMATGVKPYPSCRYGHAGIDAILALRAEHHLKAEDIDQITYGTSNAGLLLVGKPAEIKQNPTNIVGAQFSAPFVLSCAMVTGGMGWDSYKLLQDPTIRSMLAKVDCVHDPEIEAEFPANMSGKITIRTRGNVYMKKVVVPLGEPSNFLSETAVRDKFNGLARPVLNAAADVLATRVFKLDALASIKDLTEMAPAPPAH